MTCQNCKFAQKNLKRLDGLDRALVCPKLRDVLNLWFMPQVPDTFECSEYKSKWLTEDGQKIREPEAA